MSFSSKEAARIVDRFCNQEHKSSTKCCGYITQDDQKWDAFVEKNKNDIKIFTKRDFTLNNEEHWIRFPLSESMRGHKFYKVKVDRDVDENFFYMVIAPCCHVCCCDFEWI